MVDEEDPVSRYLRMKQDIVEVLEACIQQGVIFASLQTASDQDKQETQDGLKLLSDSASQFLSLVENSTSESLEDGVLLDIVSCVHKIIGGASLAFRHLEVSKSVRAGVLKEKTASGSKARTSAKETQAEKVRHIIEGAKRRPDGRLRNPGTIRTQIISELERDDLDPKTLKDWVNYIDRTRKTVDPPKNE